MRDILEELKTTLNEEVNYFWTTEEQVQAAIAEIEQLRAKLKTSRADAMEACVKILDIKFTPQAVETKFWRGWNAALAEGATAIRQRKDKADV